MFPSLFCALSGIKESPGYKGGHCTIGEGETQELTFSLRKKYKKEKDSVSQTPVLYLQITIKG